MSPQNFRPEPDELDDPQFDEEALRARRRQYGLGAVAVAIAIVAILAVPWRDHVKAGGRAAPQRWAKVHSEAPGVIREVTHTAGDTVDQGEVIAVLDYDEQRDALEAARLALSRERQKLADLELRLRENMIKREGADAVAKSADKQAVAAETIDGARLAALDPASDTVLEDVRVFTTQMRSEVSRNRSTPADAAFGGEDLHRRVSNTMARYSKSAAGIADQLVRVAGSEPGRQFRFALEDLRFAYDLVDHSMQELIVKHDMVERGFLAPVALREPCLQLEREVMQLANSFRALSGSARMVLGSPTEQIERVRGAEESRRILASESERLETERATVESGIATAELAVRSAERTQGKTAIRAPIRGTLAGESLARFDAVTANASIGVVEDSSRLVLKVNVSDADFRRIQVGQPAESHASDGRVLRGSVAWKTPFAGQAVRDQAWNVLIQLEGANAGFELGDKVTASIDVGKRSLLGRWLKPATEVAIGPRVAFVEDPTELRRQPGGLAEPGAAEHDKLALERADGHDGSSKGR